MKTRTLALGALMALILVFSCQQDEKKQAKKSARPTGPAIKIAYVKWSTEIASTHLVKAVLQERMGRKCEI
ncbi:MAG: glycine/betaine ABC transporter, partial [bacterium]